MKKHFFVLLCLLGVKAVSGMESQDVDISGLDKVKVLQGLFKIAKPQGLGFLHYKPDDSLNDKEAKKILETRNYSVDYLNGRVMKVNLRGDTLNTRLFNTDNGKDAAERVIEALNSVKN